MNIAGISRIFVIYAIFLLASGSAREQSILEYSTLTTAVGASGAGQQKGDAGSQGDTPASVASGVVTGATDKLYGESASVLSRGGALLKQAGVGVGVAGEAVGPGTRENSPINAKIIEFKDEAGSLDKPSDPEPPDITVRVNLSDGSKAEGTLVEHTDGYVRINIAGVDMTYFADGIKSIEQI